MDYTQLIEQYQEINPANYGPDDVDALNAWGIEAFAAIEALQARVLEQAAKVAEDSDHIVDVGGYHAQLGDASATQRNIVAAIRKLGEGL